MKGLAFAFIFCILFIGGMAGFAIYQAHTPTGLKCREMGGHYFMFEGLCRVTNSYDVRM